MKSEKSITNIGTYWYKPGTDILHREDGPAAEFSSGTKWWSKNGKLHREDGPAIECSNGNKKYYFNNQEITVKNDEEFKRIIKMKGFI